MDHRERDRERLLQVRGIGPERAELILNAFGSLPAFREADPAEVLRRCPCLFLNQVERWQRWLREGPPRPRPPASRLPSGDDEDDDWRPGMVWAVPAEPREGGVRPPKPRKPRSP